jgi:hypothetical protein
MSQEVTAIGQEEALEVNPVAALEQITRGEIDIQIATAKKYPRKLPKVLADATFLATFNDETAQSCWYSLTRGKGEDAKTIEGPSIRLAELMASAWGNLRIGSMITDVGEKMVTARGMVHDLETNVAYFADVQRSIWGKYGRFKTDMIITTANAAAAIATRNAIIKAIPRAYVDQVLAEARKKAMGGSVPLEVRRQKAIEFFNKSGVPTERLLVALEIGSVSEIGMLQMETLIGLHNRLKEGAPIDEVFPQPQRSNVSSLNAAIKQGEPSGASSGAPIPATNEGVIQTFLALNIGSERLEAKIGSPIAKWTEEDRTRLLAIATDILDGKHGPQDYFGD